MKNKLVLAAMAATLCCLILPPPAAFAGTVAISQNPVERPSRPSQLNPDQGWKNSGFLQAVFKAWHWDWMNKQYDKRLKSSWTLTPIKRQRPLDKNKRITKVKTRRVERSSVRRLQHGVRGSAERALQRVRLHR